MNGIDIANGIVFQMLGISKDTFDDRLICQKKIYLLQSLGTNLGYAYNWYVHGPYSPALTTYMYNNLEVLSTTSFEKYKPTEKAKANIEKVLQLAKKKTDALGVASWYELLASIVYIFDHPKSWKHNKKDDELISLLRKYKPQFSEELCASALTVLKQDGFLKDGE